MTHERIDPYFDKNIMNLSKIAHIKRYEKALKLIGTEKKILDIGCGYGYGSKILSENNDVHGIDISREAICYAKKNYFAPRVNFMEADISSKTFGFEEKFDAITFFEVLEHVTNPHLALTNIKKCLMPSGKLIISIPNSNNAPQDNEHHVNEFNLESLEQLLVSNNFSTTLVLGQYPILGSLAGIVQKFSGYQSSTNKDSGLIPKIIDSIPKLPQICSNLYSSKFLVNSSRTLYLVAEVSN